MIGRGKDDEALHCHSSMQSLTDSMHGEMNRSGALHFDFRFNQRSKARWKRTIGNRI